MTRFRTLCSILAVQHLRYYSSSVALAFLCATTAFAAGPGPEWYGRAEKHTLVFSDPDALNTLDSNAYTEAKASSVIEDATIVAIDETKENRYRESLYHVRFINKDGTCSTGWVDRNQVIPSRTEDPDSGRTEGACYPELGRLKSLSATASLDGVRIGMSKADAITALKHFDKYFVIEEIYRGGGSLLSGYPKAGLRQGDPFLFSSIHAADSRYGSSDVADPCWDNRASVSGNHPREVSAVFTPDLRDPRVILVYEETRYCRDENARADGVIRQLYQQFTSTPTRSFRIVEPGRLANDVDGTGAGGAYLEWRFDGLIGEKQPRNQLGVPIIDANGNFDWIGNRGAGVVFHEEISPQSNARYVGSTRALLWNDGAIINAGAERGWLLQEMDRQDIGGGDLSKPETVARLESSLLAYDREKSAAGAAAPTAVAPRQVDPERTSFSHNPTRTVYTAVEVNVFVHGYQGAVLCRLPRGAPVPGRIQSRPALFAGDYGVVAYRADLCPREGAARPRNMYDEFFFRATLGPRR